MIEFLMYVGLCVSPDSAPVPTVTVLCWSRYCPGAVPVPSWFCAVLSRCCAGSVIGLFCPVLYDVGIKKYHNCYADLAFNLLII